MWSAEARTSRRRQRGNTLVISLILLLILTLFGLSAINAGLVNLRIARNTQVSAEAQYAAQRAINTQLSSLANFTAPASAPSTSNIDVTGNGSTNYSVTLQPPTCVFIQDAPGYSYSLSPQAPKDTTWRLNASAIDPTDGTGASVVVRQGVKVRLSHSAKCP
jgi:hypothetical protein